MKQFDTLIIHANLATMNSQFGFGADVAYGAIVDGAVGIIDNKIAFVGAMDELNSLSHAAKHITNAAGQWLTPALIDCHTHLVYAGNRSHEFELRLNGVDYATIAKQGGGILSTVTATRQASVEELYQQSILRLQALLAQGVSTIEIKSGYGLELQTERKMLQVAKKMGEDFGVTIQKTYLAAHALPPEYQGDADGYIDKVCEWLPILHSEGLVDAVDAFCENIAFNTTQVAKVFDVATSLGLPVKLHAEQLSDMGGSGLVAGFGGLSADHIEYLSAGDIVKMAASGTVATLLPTAFYCLRETKVPPIEALKAAGVPIAVSTDCNPGTSPSTSLLLAMNMACTLFRLTPEEALAGTTIHAAKALGLQNHKGQIKVGMDADLALWRIDRPADLAYLIGQIPLVKLMVAGRYLIGL